MVRHSGHILYKVLPHISTPYLAPSIILKILLTIFAVFYFMSPFIVVLICFFLVTDDVKHIFICWFPITSAEYLFIFSSSIIYLFAIVFLQFLFVLVFVVCKYFLPVDIFRIACRVKVFHFDEVLFQIFCFMDHGFGIKSKNSLLIFRSQIFFYFYPF